jgi:hypothetical protein
MPLNVDKRDISVTFFETRMPGPPSVHFDQIASFIVGDAQRNAFHRRDAR